MNEMTKLVQNHDYLTPRIAGKSGISKFKFYKYVRENCMYFIRDARMLFFHMTRLFTIMV